MFTHMSTELADSDNFGSQENFYFYCNKKGNSTFHKCKLCSHCFVDEIDLVLAAHLCKEHNLGPETVNTRSFVTQESKLKPDISVYNDDITTELKNEEMRGKNLNSCRVSATPRSPPKQKCVGAIVGAPELSARALPTVPFPPTGTHLPAYTTSKWNGMMQEVNAGAISMWHLPSNYNMQQKYSPISPSQVYLCTSPYSISPEVTFTYPSAGCASSRILFGSTTHTRPTQECTSASSASLELKDKGRIRKVHPANTLCDAKSARLYDYSSSRPELNYRGWHYKPPSMIGSNLSETTNGPADTSNGNISSKNTPKPFRCELCDKKFSNRSNMKKHNRTHTGHKPFECIYCGKKFSQKNNLQAHSRTHTGEKPFLCNTCQASFNRKDTLTRHSRVHTGIKLWLCSFCKKQFCDKSSVIRHARHHIEAAERNGLKCLECDAMVYTAADINNHCSKHH